jgi:hypothetical protein
MNDWPDRIRDQQAITEFEWQVGSSLMTDTGEVLFTLAFRFRDPDGDYIELYFGFTQDAAQRLLRQMQTLLPAR